YAEFVAARRPDVTQPGEVVDTAGRRLREQRGPVRPPGGARRGGGGAGEGAPHVHPPGPQQKSVALRARPEAPGPGVRVGRRGVRGLRGRGVGPATGAPCRRGSPPLGRREAPPPRSASPVMDPSPPPARLSSSTVTTRCSAAGPSRPCRPPAWVLPRPRSS